MKLPEAPWWVSPLLLAWVGQGAIYWALELGNLHDWRVWFLWAGGIGTAVLAVVLVGPHLERWLEDRKAP